jgi:hypothetical protein
MALNRPFHRTAQLVAALKHVPGEKLEQQILAVEIDRNAFQAVAGRVKEAEAIRIPIIKKGAASFKGPQKNVAVYHRYSGLVFKRSNERTGYEAKVPAVTAEKRAVP